MAQELEQILDLLREIKRANNSSSESFERLLASLENRVDTLERNEASGDLFKAYFSDLNKAVDNRYVTTLDKFTEIEKALRTIYNAQDEHVKNQDLRELFDVFTQNLNNFYVESRQQKSIVASIESRLVELGANQSDKDEILRSLSLLRGDYEKLNQSYKIGIDNVASDLKTVISNLLKIDQSAVNAEIQTQVSDMYKATSDIINYLKLLDSHETNLEKILLTTATSESLKYTQSAIDLIIDRTDGISEKLSQISDETSTKEQFSHISDKADELSQKTNDVKKSLAKITKDIETLPDTAALEEALQDVYNKIKNIEDDLMSTNVKGDVKELDGKINTFASELFTVKNIISDLSEVVNSKLLAAVNEISFEKECFEIKQDVSKMLSMLPQKEDVDRLLDNDDFRKKSLDKIIEKVDNIADALDNLPTHADMEGLNNNQLSLVENLQAVAGKDDIEKISSKADDIEQMIDKLNFDNEFEQIYDKSSSIEKWLIDSKVKENTEDILSKVEDKAEQKEVLNILKTTEAIVNNIEELSKNVDVKKVNRTVAEVYQLIEDLKNDFINTSEMHNDSVIVHLSELQKSIENAVTGEEFENFVQDLKNFVDKVGQDMNTSTTNFDEIRSYQETILAKLSEINTSAIEDVINKKVSTLDEKLVTISEYITNMNVADTNLVKSEISEIKEILSNKKSNISEIEDLIKDTMSSIEKYVQEVKVVLDTSKQNTDSSLKSKIAALEELLNSYHSENENSLSTIITRLEDLQYFIDDQQAARKKELKNTIRNVADIGDNLRSLITSFSKTPNSGADAKTSGFIASSLDSINSTLTQLNDNVESNIQTGFTYNAQLLEEKTSVLLDFIKEMKSQSHDSSDMYEKLSVADNKLSDIQQSIQVVNSDFINYSNNQSEIILKEIIPLKEMLNKISTDSKENKETVIQEELDKLHDSITLDLEEVTRYSKSTYDRLEDTYDKIQSSLTSTENNLRDFILGDIDSVILKIESLKQDLENSIQGMPAPKAEQMKEFQEFADRVSEFKQQQNELAQKITQDVITSQKEISQQIVQDVKAEIETQITEQYEELKSVLQVAANKDDIILAIEALKSTFENHIKDFIEKEDELFSNLNSDLNSTEDEEEKLASSLKWDFDKFSAQIEKLSGDNQEIKDVLSLIREKMEIISISDKNFAGLTDINEENFDIDEVKLSDIDSDFDSDSDDEKTLVGIDNFDFIKAFDLLKQDIQNLDDKVSSIIPKLDDIGAKPANSESILTSKLDALSEVIDSRQWLDEIKTYIAGDKIQATLDEIKSKIDILSLSGNSELLSGVKEALEKLNLESISKNSVEASEIRSMLSSIDNKIDVLATASDASVLEDVIDAIDNIDLGANSQSGKLLNSINSKIDVIASSDNTDDFDDIKQTLDSIDNKIIETGIGNSDELSAIKDSLNILESKVDILAETDVTESFDDIRYTLMNVDEKIDSVKKLSEADDQITSMLEELNEKVDELFIPSDETLLQKKDLKDIKELITTQSGYIANLENNTKTEALKKCLQELSEEINNYGSGGNSEAMQKTIKEMKESIMGAVVTVFDQVSFVEESEDIKDFVEEKTDEINKNLAFVTNQLKQITSTSDEPDYTYSMQDIESDLAKMRLALNELQVNDKENHTARLTSILENISQIGDTVENLQNSLTKEEAFGLKTQFDSINTDIRGLNDLTNQLLEKSAQSYDAINNNFENFGKNITTNLTTKVDKVTKLLEKSNASDKVMRQALIYMGEWIDSASESMNKISTNSDEIVDIKFAIDELKLAVPEQKELLNAIGERFDEQQERLAFFEKQINKLSSVQEKIEDQQDRIDRLEIAIQKVLSVVEEIDDSKVSRKIDKLDKQLAKMSVSIEKLTSYVD